MKTETKKKVKKDAIRSFKLERLIKIVHDKKTILNPTWEQIKAIKGIYSVEFIKDNGDLRKANCINLTEDYSEGKIDTSNDKTNGTIRFLDMALTMDKGIGIDKATKLIIKSLEDQVGYLQDKLAIKENALENLEKLIK